MEVEFFCSAEGTNYVGDVIESQLPKGIKKIERQLELIEEMGINYFTYSGCAKKLHGFDLYEIMVSFGKMCYRIFCVIRNTTCWLMHMFVKKSNDTPRREIDTALNRVKILDRRLALAVN